MKRLTFLAILMFLFDTSFSQTQVGLKGGIAFLKCIDNTIQGPGDYKYPQPSYFLSVILRDRHPDFFNMGGELEYFHRYFHIKSSEGGVSGTTTFDYNIACDYIRINLQPQFIFGKKIRIFIYPGIYCGYMFHSHIQGKSYYRGILPPWEMPLDDSGKEYMTSWEIGAKFGIGIDVPIYKGLNLVCENFETFNFLSSKPKFGLIGSYHVFEFCFGVGLAYTLSSRPENQQKQLPLQ